MRKVAEQGLFVLTCAMAALFMGAGWGALIYQFDREVGWWIGVGFGGFTFWMLVCAGWDVEGRYAEKRNRRFDD